MIKCHLSRMMGERKLNIAKLHKELSISRGVLSRLYHETFTRMDKNVIDQLCKYFDCQVGDLFEYVEED